MATILKNNIKPGGNALRGLVAVDASGNAKDVKFVRQVDASGAATTIYDTLKEYSYSDITISAFSYGDIPANGNAITPSALTYSQVRTEVGESGATYGTATLNSGATVTYSGTGVNATTGAISATKLDASDKPRTKITTVTVTIELNGKSASKSFDVYQQANTITVYGDVSAPSVSQKASFPASGVTLSTSNVGDYYSTGTSSQTITYTSGATRAGSISYAWSGANTTVASRGTTEDAAETTPAINALTYTATGEGGKTNSGNTGTTGKQIRNVRSIVSIYLSPYQPDATWITTVTNGNWNTVPASGGYLKTRGYANYTHTSGSPLNDQLITNDASLSWSTGFNSWITAHSNGGYYVANRGTSTGDARSATGTWSYGGKTATKAFTQQANALTGTGNYNGKTQACYQSYTEYQVVSFASVGDIPAYGGSSYGQGTGQSRTNYKTSSYTKYEIHNIYTSGSHAHNGSYTTASGWTDGSAPSAGAWGGNTTVKGSTVSGTSLGTTTTSARTNKGNSTTTWNGVACSVAIYQAINAKSSTAATALNGRTQACYKAVTEYQIVNFVSLGDVPASGGKSKGQGTGQSRTNYTTSSYTKYDYYFTWTAYAGDSNAKQFSYTSTASGWTDGSAPAASAWGGNTTVTGSEVSGSNLTTTTKARTSLGNSSVTWNGKTASVAIYQAANALGTQHYKNTSGTTGDNWAYGTPSNPTLTNNLTAKGGSVTCSGSTVKNTKTYYLMYTSGSYSGLQTETPAGSVGYTISSNGNSRFAFASGSGTVINHSNMTTNATTDTLGVKAYNASDSSKQSAQVTASVTNSYSDAWNNPSISAYTYTSSSFAYSGGSSSSPTVTASQSGTRTFTTGSTSTISNSTFTKSYSMSATGFSVNSSTGIVTAAANNGAARSGTVTVTVTGAGKSATKTYTFSQAVHPTNGYAYVDLGLASGLKWADRTVGATSVGDFGCGFVYGNTTAIVAAGRDNWTKQITTFPNYVSSGTISGTANDMVKINMGGNWVLPTQANFSELINAINNPYTTPNSSQQITFITKSNKNLILGSVLIEVANNGNKGIYSITDWGDLYVFSGSYSAFYKDGSSHPATMTTLMQSSTTIRVGQCIGVINI